MEDTVSSPSTSPNIRKRSRDTDEEERAQKPLNLKGNQFVMPTPPDTENERSSNASPGGSVESDRRERAASPVLRTSTSLNSVIEVPSSNAVPASSVMTTQSIAPESASMSDTGPPAKRRKLTPAEKSEQAQLKETKAREKAEKKAAAEEKKAQAEAEKEERKAQVEEEKARKAEEKRLKDEEKRAKAEEKEAKKREKELEETKKQEEKLAKERKQMRLGAFFGGKPSTPAKRSIDGEEIALLSRQKSLSLEPFDAASAQLKSTTSPVKHSPAPASSKKSNVSDYHKTFLPFEAPTHSQVAPVVRDEQADQARFDHDLNDPLVQEKFDLGLVSSYASLDSYFSELRNARRGKRGHPNIRKVVERAQGTSKEPIDLTEEGSRESPDSILRKVDTKYIHFHEDVRPAYCGTYTKLTSPRTTRRTMRNPFTRSRPDTDYDYDSEAEWEEPEEGEDIGSDDDEEADSNADGDEMDDFLDDEDDKAKSRRKAVTVELIPQSTGLCFANDRGRVLHVDGAQVAVQPPVMDGMRMGFLLPGLSGMTIDPFSTSYWETPAPAHTAANAISSGKSLGTRPSPTAVMAPPRKPLEPRLNFNSSAESAVFALIGAADGQKGPVSSTTAMTPAVKRGRKPQPKALSKEDLDELKAAVVGNQLGKLDLHKALKARYVFPSARAQFGR